MTFARIIVAAIAIADCAGGAAAEEPRDFIKKYRFAPTLVEYSDGGRSDPFEPLVPLRMVKERDKLKVRIESLRVSSVLAGKHKVAIFTELHGPTSYILVNSVLLGSDRKPIPGIMGMIEELNRYGEYRVTLKQGADKVVFTVANKDLSEMKAMRGSGR